MSLRTGRVHSEKCQMQLSSVSSVEWCNCSGSQVEFNEMTPEFIGKMVYSSITYSRTPARQHGLMCFGHYILHTESDSQSLIHRYSGLTPTQ